MNITIDPTLTGKALYEHLVINKPKFIAQKKAEKKLADGIPFNKQLYITKGTETVKVLPDSGNQINGELRVIPIINTTFYHDGHDDVHIDGLWDKSLQENKFMIHLQEHIMKFTNIIADGDDVKAFTQKIPWRQLGLEIDGQTEALMFDSSVKKSRNEYMYDQYIKGYVKNHSVGMNYVKLELAINDADYKDEFAVWNKYIDRIANKDYSESMGYFWAVKEAKVIEGSAVPKGSNPITPTYSVSQKDTVIEPLKDTQNQPLPKAFDVSEAIKKQIFIL